MQSLNDNILALLKEKDNIASKLETTKKEYELEVKTRRMMELRITELLSEALNAEGEKREALHNSQAGTREKCRPSEHNNKQVGVFCNVHIYAENSRLL